MFEVSSTFLIFSTWYMFIQIVSIYFSVVSANIEVAQEPKNGFLVTSIDILVDWSWYLAWKVILLSHDSCSVKLNGFVPIYLSQWDVWRGASMLPCTWTAYSLNHPNVHFYHPGSWAGLSHLYLCSICFHKHLVIFR